MVAAIIHRENLLSCILVESDKRKAAFLRTVKRELGLNVHVVADRVERVVDTNSDIISARAFAPLTRLLDVSFHLQQKHTSYLLMKGQAWPTEVEEAKQKFCFELEVHPSVTQEGSATLQIWNVKRRAEQHV